MGGGSYDSFLPAPFLFLLPPSLFPPPPQIDCACVNGPHGAFERHMAGQQRSMEHVRVFWVFVIIFSLFLNKIVFSLDLLSVAIYGMKFYLFSQVLFSQTLKNNGIGFWLIFCFLMVHFLEANHRLMTEEISSIKNYRHYGKCSKGDCC